MDPNTLRPVITTRRLTRLAALSVLLALAAVSLAACGSSGGSADGSATGAPVASASAATSPSSPTSAAPSPGAPASPVPALSLQQLAGQRVIFSYRGLTPPASLLAKIRAGEAAGVVFFSGNISSRAQIRRVIAELQLAAAQSSVKAPLLLMTDQEGGLVRRLPGAPLLSAKQIGASADPASAARQAGRGAGLNLSGVGMNVNLAPVLDVYRTPDDFFDQFGRSYSMNPRVVAPLGADFIEAQQQAGVAATAKHFPGLGAASRLQNTDQRAVTLNVALATLRAVDELPYPPAISAGVRLIMVSWATYPALDPRRPAGLSSAVVRRELRKRLKFTGVTITDSLGAGALSAFGAIGNRAVLAARAGMDLLLCADKRVSQGTGATNALASALRGGQLDRPAFLASVGRVMALRSSLDTSAPAAGASIGDLSSISSTLSSYFAAVNAKDFGTARQQFTPSLRQSISIAHLASTDATTHDFAVVIHDVTPLDAQTAVVYVTFTSTQDASQGPNGDTRDDWTLDYTMKLVGGRWLIDTVAGHNGSTHNPA